MADFVRQGLHPLCGGVGDLDPDAMQLVRAVAVDAAGKLCILHSEADGGGNVDESGEESGRIVPRKRVAHARKLLAVRGGDVEHRDHLEASDHSLLVFGLLVVVRLVDHGGKNPDGLLSLADEASVLPPGVEPSNVRGFVPLHGDEHDVVRAVAVEAALAIEVTLPLLGCRELCNSLGQLCEQFGTIGCGGHFLALLVGADAMHPKSRRESERNRSEGVHP